MKASKILNGGQLKLIAMITMLIDHIGLLIVYPLYQQACFVDGVDMLGASAPREAQILYAVYMIMRSVGRLALPIFAFMIVEGFLHTRSVKKYIRRLAIFAIISEIPFDLAFHNELIYSRAQNVMWTFLIAVVMLYVMQKTKLNAAKAILITVCAGLLAYFCDGGIGTIFMIASMYLFRNSKKHWWFGCTLSILIITTEFMWIQLFAIVSLALLQLYNGERGKVNKYVFYIFYPAHLLILALIGQTL